MARHKLTVAVTGLGVSREGFIQNYLAAPETEVILFHDIDAERAKAVSEEFGGIPWTTEYEDVLASAADIVDVSTPNHCHAPQSVAALEAGKHVLCQKPMAPTVADCRAMVEAARRTGKTLGMCMTYLSRPFAADIRRMVQEGLLGRIASMRTRNAHRTPLLSEGQHGWRAKRENIGGGSFMQLAVHGMNFVLWCLGENVTSVMGYSKNLYCRHSMEGEDVTLAVGELESGALIAMESGYSSVGNAVEIFGTDGHIVMTERQFFLELARDFEGCCLTYSRPDSPNPTVHIDMAELRKQTEHLVSETNQNRAFARAVLAGEEPPVPGEVGMRDVAIIQAIYKSAETGRRVEVGDLLKP